MIITINPVLVAEVLATQSVTDEMPEESTLAMAKELDSMERYTPKAQECYEKWYDYYFEILTNMEIDHDHRAAHQAVKPTIEVSQEVMDFINGNSIQYKSLGPEIIYEVNGKFFYLKLKQDVVTENPS